MTLEASVWDRWHELEADMAPLYDMAADLAFYEKAVAVAPGITVELGVGDGRVAAVTRPSVGVDVSEAMLRLCAQRLGENVRLIRADMRNYILSEEASLSYCPMNSFCLLSPDELRTAFRNILANTAPGGRLLFDVINPNDRRKAYLSDQSRIPTLRGRTDASVVYEVIELEDRATMRTTVHTITDRLAWPQGTLRDRTYYPPYAFYWHSPGTVRDAALAAGWDIDFLHDGFAGDVFEEQGDRQVWQLCRARRG